LVDHAAFKGRGGATIATASAELRPRIVGVGVTDIDDKARQ
jgi:hypothetical protein